MKLWLKQRLDRSMCIDTLVLFCLKERTRRYTQPIRHAYLLVQRTSYTVWFSSKMPWYFGEIIAGGRRMLRECFVT